MSRWSDLKSLTNKNISVPISLLLCLSLILISPYFILSYYNNPSIDDYSFVFNVDTLGFWKAQANWYMTWTGRYFSIFVLSIHPLLFDSITLYKLVALLLIVLTVHSLYQFITIAFRSGNHILNLLLSIGVAFCFLNGMPSLVQGIYWMPGAMTYHLANVFTLYLATNIVRSLSDDTGTSTVSKKIANGLLILAICGLNETSMVVVDLLLGSFIVYDTIKKRKIRTELLIYVLLAVACSLIVLLSPGNTIRDKDATDIHKHQVLYTIISSGKAGYHYILHWMFSPQIIISTILVCIYHLTIIKNSIVKRYGSEYFILIAIGGVLLIVASFSTGFWSTGNIAPDRTINVAYWLFICVWLATLLSFLNFINPVFSVIKNKNYTGPAFVFILILILSIDRTGNYFMAVKDLLTGKAFIYNKECIDRDKIMKTSKEKIVTIPSFSVFPTSIFNEDITSDEKNWWNYMYSHYYNRGGVRVVFRDPYFSIKHFFNFENELNQLLDNQKSISNEMFFSPPSSSLLPGPDSYSATFKKPVSELGFEDISEVSTTHLSAQFYSSDSTISAVLVFCISDPITKKDVFWRGKDINSTNYPKNTWTKEEFIVPIDKKCLRPENIVAVYVWNRGKSKLFVDDLLISIY